MEFLARYAFAVVGLFAVYGAVHVCHLAGRAYWLHCVVRNAKRHQAWMEWRFR